MFTLDDRELEEIKISIVCHSCRNLTDGYEKVCNAFTEIPNEIWEGRHDHKTPYPGDNGIRFESVI